MEREQLRELVSGAIAAAIADGELPDVSVNVEISLPKNPEHGDFATNAAMIIASQAKTNPREVHKLIIGQEIFQDRPSK